MANITVEFSGKVAKVNFGDYWKHSGQPLANERVNDTIEIFQIANINEVRYDGTYTYVQMLNFREWCLGTVQTADCFVIDTINTVAPSDNEDILNIIYSHMQ